MYNTKQVLGDRFYITLPSDKILTRALYGNANEFAWAIVAVINSYNGTMIDWAAYIGGCDLTQIERDCLEWVAAKGNKMSLADAEHFFPYLPVEKYRS